MRKNGEGDEHDDFDALLDVLRNATWSDLHRGLLTLLTKPPSGLPEQALHDPSYHISEDSSEEQANDVGRFLVEASREDIEAWYRLKLYMAVTVMDETITASQAIRGLMFYLMSKIASSPHAILRDPEFLEVFADLVREATRRRASSARRVSSATPDAIEAFERDWMATNRSDYGMMKEMSKHLGVSPDTIRRRRNPKL